MSHTFVDENLNTWEAFASSGHYGLSTTPRIIFNCLSDPGIAPRYLEQQGGEAEAEGETFARDDNSLRELLRSSHVLE